MIYTNNFKSYIFKNFLNIPLFNLRTLNLFVINIIKICFTRHLYKNLVQLHLN